jgi:hypothetical protein
MPTYMLILSDADLDKRSGSPERDRVMMDRYMAWIRELKESGRFVSSQKLHDRTGARLSMRGGQVVEGPFIESKEAVGGIFVITAPSLDEAVASARTCPILDLQNGTVEVRVVEEPRLAR